MRFSSLIAVFFTVLACAASPLAAQIDVSPRDGRHALGLNLSEVAGWSTEAPFIDVMHNASRWVGHLPGQWGGMDEDALRDAGALDDDGWVIAIPRTVRRLSTFVLMDLPAEMTSTAGTWHATWEGSAYLSFSGAARNVRFGDNSATFEFTPGQGSVLIEFNRGTLRNLSIVHERNLARHAAGEVFNPDFLARLQGVETLRFMDWMLTNNSTVEHWDQRAQMGDYSWSRRGVPLEILLRLANETGAEPWFTLPHRADDAYIRQFAQTVRDGLNPDLRGWFEFSNEIWNWSFTQADWAEQSARARWNREWAWVQYGAVRSAQAMGIIDAVYAGATERRVRVLGLFTAWLGLEHDMLTAPDYMAEYPTHRPPSESFDALAVTGYFSGELHSEDKQPLVQGWLRDSRAAAETDADAQGLTGEARDAFIAAHRFDTALDLAAQELLDGSVSGNAENSVRDLLDRTLPHHVAVAQDYGMALVMYEGGTHVVVRPQDHGDEELVAFFTALNQSAQMGELYRTLIAGWRTLTPAPFVAFNDIGKPSVWGSWGHLRHIDDDTPRWTALIEATAP
ncbi:hypothetical protein [Pararhodobacter zhoushanensis]|uniref:hypothetical protein n=1 Tax=Pararhodobacter zhoushanensis TaxID=2479545 RepID=UPI000F8F4A9F|nr:hypothetical protein [Pararhodobacter zhoushanensis]